MADLSKELSKELNKDFAYREDTISRQAAIEALDEIESEVADGYGYQYEKWRKYFCGLPSVQPEPRWIPCSERPPEKDGRYQVTRHDDVTNTEFIDILWYEENLWWNRHSTGDYAVTAWMPLPEPYRRGGEDE